MGKREDRKLKSKSNRAGAYRTNQKFSTKAPFIRRSCAYLTDWFFGELFASFPIVFYYSILYDTAELNSSLQTLTGIHALLAGMLSLLCLFLYFVVVPWKIMKGQTIGKRLANLRIIGHDGQSALLWQLLVRQVWGLLLLEGSLLGSSSHIWEMLFVITGFPQLLTYPRYIGMVFSVISIFFVLITSEGRALHDYMASTKVVYVRNDK